MNERRKLLLGIGVTTSVAAWHKPIINSVMVPVHAQTSPVEPPPPPPTPAEVCPMIGIGNVVTGPVSGTFTPPVCSITFDVLSGTPGTPLTITDITNTVAADTTVIYDGFGEATDTTGPRVVWRGPASDAPFCTDLVPIEEVTFTVTATCAAAPMMGTFTRDFTLAQILA